MTQGTDHGIVVADEEDDPTPWWKLVAYGAFVAALTVALYVYISHKEAAGGDIRLWWLLALVHDAVGTWGTVAIPGAVSLIMFGFGFAELADVRKKARDGAA